jgi:hypothetical protein
LFLLHKISGVDYSGIRAEEPAADVRPCFVDAAAPLYKKFASIVYLQFMRSIERQLQAFGPQLLKLLVLVPADLYGCKRAAAGTAALLTAIITIPRRVEKDSVKSFLSE